MRFQKFSFGSIRIDGITHEHDVVIDRGKVRKRKKRPSKKFREAFGHTPISVEEEIPAQADDHHGEAEQGPGPRAAPSDAAGAEELVLTADLADAGPLGAADAAGDQPARDGLLERDWLG